MTDKNKLYNHDYLVNGAGSMTDKPTQETKRKKHTRELLRITAGLSSLSLEELQALKPERVRASTKLFEILSMLVAGTDSQEVWDNAEKVVARIEAEEKKQ